MIRVFLLVMAVLVLSGLTFAQASEGVAFAGGIADCRVDCEIQINLEPHETPASAPERQTEKYDDGCSVCGSQHPVVGEFGGLAQLFIRMRGFLPPQLEARRSAKVQRLDRPPIHG